MAVKCPTCQSDNPDASRFCAECGTQLGSVEDIEVSQTKTLETPVEELTRGTLFADRYEIIEELGKGGMGKVYRVEDKKTGEELALKLIKPEISADKKTIERFGNELKLAHKISHRNVCRMFHLGEEKGTHYITMEYVPGEDLKSFIRRARRLDIGTAISIALQVCDGLTEAHRLGVVHRDLKPSNIMIDKEGNARIMDFGIARSLKAKGITGAGLMVGTPEYMSPEQAEAKEVDRRSDLYSLGVILYEMVTGQLPFEGDTPLSIAMKHKGEKPKDPNTLNPQIPEDMNHLILKCMEKDKEKRYESAEELHSELDNIEKGIPTTQREAPKKLITSKEITVSLSLKKLLIPALAVVALIIAALILWQLLPQKEPVSLPIEKPSIAVLPFEDLSRQKDQAYFCDGLTEELINRLSRIESLKVPGRTSTFSIKGKELDIQEIGERLNVETVLEGSVRKAENKLRITVQLVTAESGVPLWSEKYEREMKDIFALQDEISLQIVDNLKIRLLGEEKAQFVKHDTHNPEAYNSYLMGRFFWNKRTEEALKESVKYFEQAIEKDPTYALAYAGLSDSYIMLGDYEFISPKVAFPKGKAAAAKALEIDDLLAEAHTSLAFAKFIYDWDWLSAEKAFKQAITLNPSYATARQWYAEYLTAMGRFDEAIKEIKRAQELDPLSIIVNTIGARVFYYAREYDRAIEQCLNTLEMDPDFFVARRDLGSIYLQEEMYEEALVEFKKTNSQVWIGLTYAKLGKMAEARQVLDNLIELSDQSEIRQELIGVAKLYFALGEIDQGFRCLEEAYEERSSGLTRLKIDPLYDSVRSNPRFKALLKRMGLE